MILNFIIGVIFIYLGSETLVRGGISLATHLKVPPLVIGLTVVGFGTSSPELFVAIKGFLTKHPDISLGDVIGANILNIVILSFCSLFRKISLSWQTLRFDIPATFAAYFLFIVFASLGHFPRWSGILFIFLIIVYILAIYFFPRWKLFLEKEENKIVEELGKPLQNYFVIFMFIIGGVVSLIYGSQFLVKAAVRIAETLNIAESAIGISLVSMCTTLPEFSASLLALKRNKPEIVVGNIIGSNIFNILFVLGLAVTIQPIQSFGIRNIDLMVMLLSLFFVYPFFQKENTYPRIKGTLLLIGYLIYLYYLAVR